MADDESPDRTPDDPPEEDAPQAEEASGGGDDDADEDGPRPISVRDLMPEPSPARRDRPSPSGGPDDADRETAADAVEVPPEREPEPDEEDDGEEASRPTPVRVAMDAPPPGDSRPVDSLPSRTFEARGREWIVRVTGRTITGTRPDAGAHLMQLEFYHAEEPDEPVRELLTVERSLEALYPRDLDEFLERSRPADRTREGVG